MLGIGFFELLLILGVTVFFLDKDSIREVFRMIRILNLRLEGFKKECLDYLREPLSSKRVVGDDKKEYEAYDLPGTLQQDKEEGKVNDKVKNG